MLTDNQLIDVLSSAILERNLSIRPLFTAVNATNTPAYHKDIFCRIVENLHLGVWSWNISSGEVFFNEGWARIIGFPVADIAQTSLESTVDRIHPDDKKNLNDFLLQFFAGGADRQDVEARIEHCSGRWIWISFRWSVVSRTAEGEIKEILCILQDVTTRKDQEEILRKNQAFLNRTSHFAGVGGWEFDLFSGRVVWCNETRRIHGVTADYVPTTGHHLEFCAPEARPLVAAAIDAAIHRGIDFDLQVPFIRVDGERIWVRYVGAVEFSDGIPKLLAGSIQDITERVAERLALELANERLTLATNSGGIGIWDWDIINDKLTWDSWMYRLYGKVENDEAQGILNWAKLIHPEDYSSVRKALKAAIRGQELIDVEFRAMRLDGETYHIHGTGLIKRDSNGRAVRMVGTNWDVTEARHLTTELAEQHEMLRVTLNSIGDAVITTDVDGRILWLNPVAEALTGWLSSEATGRPLIQVFNIVNQQTKKPAENPVSTCLREGRVVCLANQTLLIARDGTEFGIEDSASPIRNDHQEILGAVLVFHDVTEQRRLSGEMSYRATHDTLTGLLNRTEFEVRLNRALRKSHDEGVEHSLLYIDLDHFKLVNDACGHSIGDQLLQQVSKLLAKSVRDSDTLARLGGDEFGVILGHCSYDQAQRVAQQICDSMEEFRFINDGRRFRIGTSIGLVPIDSRWRTAESLQQAADTSCYAAKEAGRNRVHTWFDSDQAMHLRYGEMQWTTRIEQALDEDRFVLYAQRIKSLRESSSGIHAEVLLRMLDADGTLISPGAFLSAAERFHLAPRIDRWVVKRTIAWMRALPDITVVDNLSVNLSGKSVGDKAFHRWAFDVLSSAGPDICSRLCFEVTETAAVTNLADAALFIEQIRVVGVRVALDDFGAGASSFGYLKMLPVDYLKIDGQFIKDLVDDPLDDAAVRCFVDVAGVIGVKTVAEFVDSQRILDRLLDIGADFVQGFLLHKPSPIDELLRE